MLTGWDIDILTEDEESRRRQEEFSTRSQMFIDALDVEDVIAHLLVTEGFTSVEEVGFVPIGDVTVIEGFDEEIAEELQARARAWLEERDAKLDIERRKLGVDDTLAGAEGLTLTQIVDLGRKGIRTLEDLSDLTSDELRFLMMPGETDVKLDDMLNMQEYEVNRLVRTSPMSVEDANAIIMAARRQIYGDIIDAVDEVEADAGSEAASAEAATAEHAGAGE